MKETILKILCDYFDMTVEEIKGSGKHASSARLRCMWVALCRDILPCSEMELMRFINRAHNRGYYRQQHEKEIQVDRRYKKEYLFIKGIVENFRYDDFEARMIAKYGKPEKVC